MASKYQARSIHSAQEFLQLSQAIRSKEPISTQIIGGAAAGVIKGTSSYDRCTWWVVESEGVVVGIAMHTEPFNLFLSPMPIQATFALAELIVREHSKFPGVNGPSEVVKPFLKWCAELSKEGMRYEMHQEHLTYLLEEIIAPANILGEIRLATSNRSRLYAASISQEGVCEFSCDRNLPNPTTAR